MIVDPITATASALNTPIKQLSYASIVLRYITTAATTPWLLNVNMGAPTCGAGTKGFSANIWFSQLVFGPTRGLLIAYAMPASAGKAKVYTAEVTVSVWGAVNATMVIWNYVAMDSAERNPENLMRSLFNIVPGQLCRFLATPDMQEPLYGIPILVEVLLIEVGYGSSVAVAVNQIGT